MAIGTFGAEVPGVYDVITAGSIDDDAHVAIGAGVPSSTIASVVGAFLVIGATFLGGLVLFIVTAVRRSGSRADLGGAEGKVAAVRSAGLAEA